MESYLDENFDLTSKNPTVEALQRWRKLCGVVKNPMRRFRVTANLSKRMEAEAMRRAQQEKLAAAVLVSKAAEDFIMTFGKASTDEEGDEEGGDEKKDEGGGDKGGGGKGGGGGSSEKKDKPDDSEKKDKEGGGRAGEKKDKTSGELRKMGANNVYGGWFMYGPGTCAEAVLDEPKQEEWLLTGFAFIVSVCHSIYIAAGVGTVTIHLCEWANRFSPSLVVDWF